MEHKEESDNEEQTVPKSIYNREKVQARLNRVNKVTLKIFNKYSKNKLKRIPWTEQLSVCNQSNKRSL